MLRHRALGNCIKFNFPHLLQGFSLVEDDDTVEHTYDSVPRGGQKIDATDNASKLLKKEGTKAIEAEIVEEEKITPVKNARLIGLMKKAGSKKEDVLAYYKVKELTDLTVSQGDNLEGILNKKIKVTDEEKNKKENSKPEPVKKEEVKKEGPKNEEPVKKEEPKEESKAAQQMKGGIKEAKFKEIPEEICKYLNDIKDINESFLSDDILQLKVDCDTGNFKGIEAYPTLAKKIEMMDKGKTEKEEPKEELKEVELTTDIMEVANELMGHDPNELNEDQHKFINDINQNKFYGKENYKNVKF